MKSEKFLMVGGARGGGKAFQLEQNIERLMRELQAVKAERDRLQEENRIFRDKMMRISQTDDEVRGQRIIRIDYLDLVDSQTAWLILEKQLRDFLESFDRKNRRADHEP